MQCQRWSTGSRPDFSIAETRSLKGGFSRFLFGDCLHSSTLNCGKTKRVQRKQRVHKRKHTHTHIPGKKYLNKKCHILSMPNSFCNQIPAISATFIFCTRLRNTPGREASRLRRYLTLERRRNTVVMAWIAVERRAFVYSAVTFYVFELLRK